MTAAGTAHDPSWLERLCDPRPHGGLPPTPFAIETGTVEWSAAVGHDVVAVTRGSSCYAARSITAEVRSLVLCVICFEARTVQQVSLRALQEWLRGLPVPDARCARCRSVGWLTCPACDGIGADHCGVCRLCVSHGMPPGRVQCPRCEGEAPRYPVRLGATVVNAVALQGGLRGFLSREIDTLEVREGVDMLVLARSGVRVGLPGLQDKALAAYPLVVR